MRFFLTLLRAADLRAGIHARTIRSDAGGAIAIMFAILLVPMIGAVGLAVDYSRVLSLRSQAQTAADGAALLAVNVAKAEFVEAGDKPVDTRQVLEDARVRAQHFFKSYADEIPAGSAAATVDVTFDGARFVARVDYTINLRTTLGGILGYDSMSGMSTSGTISSLPLHYDIHLMLDNSNSMGLAATEQDMRDLYTATTTPESEMRSCVFGCHVPVGRQTKTNEQVAEENDITMRIDVLRDATKNLAARAEASMQLGEGLYRIGLRTFSTHTVELLPLTDNMRTVATTADRRVGLGPNTPPGNGDTYYEQNLRGVRYRIRNGTRDGLSRANAKQFLILVTDGVGDYFAGYCPHSGRHCTHPIDPRWCDSIKERGVTVGVIYTTYLPITENPFEQNSRLESNYTELVLPFADEIAPKLEQCASKGWFFEATYEEDIHAAFEQVFKQVARPPTLTH